MNIFLIGYRCSGKTSVGQALAKILDRSFYDADEELVQEQGMDISEIVRIKGWGAFRKMERDIIKRLCAEKDCVVATGGGAVLDDENVANMKKSGVIVWLQATPETIKKRILIDDHTQSYRPALTAKGLVAEIEVVLLERRPYYQGAMNLSVDTDLISIKDICNFILKSLPGILPLKTSNV